MKSYLVPAIATVMIASSIGAASAANTMSMSKSPSGQSMAQDNLSLSARQKTTAWRDLSKQGARQQQPSTFTASVGTAVPDAITLRPISGKASAQVPALRPYQYALLQDKLLIINPKDKKIVDVISAHT
jgi:hypothetical protein